MNNIEKFLSDFRQLGELKGDKSGLIGQSIINGLEAVMLDMRMQQSYMSQCLGRMDDIEKQIRKAQSDIDNLRHECNDYERRVTEVINRDEPLNTLKHDFENLSINVRNNNSIISKIQSDVELAKVNLSTVKRQLKGISSAAPVQTVTQTAVTAPAVTAPAASDSEYETIDYFDFENHFRGSIESIKNAQRFYLKYFAGKNHVLDIGCGRGEFLSLLRENGIAAEGADVYEPYVEYCRMNGLKAVCMDGIDYLASLDKTDGIFVGQVVEHLEAHDIIRLCNTACEKLTEGGCIVIETPNPTSLAIYTNAFYIDPSHVKPVHPLTMKYYLEKAGFRNIEIIYPESSRPPHAIPELKCSSAENADEFNRAMKTVSDIIFGSQDYAVVAVK